MKKISDADITALKHSGDFDADWYTDQYPDVLASGMDPAEHYLWIGKEIGRYPSAQAAPENKFNASLNKFGNDHISPRFNSFGVIEHNPLISLLIVSFNSEIDLKNLLPTIKSQTYKNIEVILVENGLADTELLLKSYFPANSKYFKADNVGFAEANNIALRESEGELIALINPDTRLSACMLQNLLDAMRYDESAAAVVPKINFFERFITLNLKANSRFSVKKQSLLDNISYKKIFVRSGIEDGDFIDSDESGFLSIDLPYVEPRSTFVEFINLQFVDHLKVQIGYSSKEDFLLENIDSTSIELKFDDLNCSSARYLINNAGSALHPDGSPYDRGFAQFDDGTYFNKAYVPALCGCAALIRRIAVLERSLFTGEFFAYYEDSELSYWLCKKGYRILYQPDAVIYHRHSESTDEHSLVWNVLVKRSKQLYDIITGADPLPLQFFSFAYPDELSNSLREKLESFDRKISSAQNHGQLIKPARRTVCLYNTYFYSMGGGEKHALDVISLLKDDYDVYLASEVNFDIQELENYFSVDLSNVKKLISTKIDTHFTSKFDMFINSTFRSNLVAAAAENLYIVSFPHSDVDERIVQNYKFLHNSEFTSEWAKRYWGTHSSEVILPILGNYNLEYRQDLLRRKENLLLSVGRFTYDGHCKNHHIILDSYKRLVAENPDFGKWRLLIIGSCDYSQQGALQYLTDLRLASQGCNVEIMPNAPREILDDAYLSAAIYVHAAGLMVSQNRPELHEHFGITTFEALANGCMPVVYHLGGPAAQVRTLTQAKLFTDIESLQNALKLAITASERGNIEPEKIREHARVMHKTNLEFARNIFIKGDITADRLTAANSRAALNKMGPE